MAEPRVSCLMPTADRRRFVPLAVRCFLAQDWPNRELVILDDGVEPVADLLPSHPDIRYLRLPPGNSLGVKRNLCAEAASGELLMHWDDDDWMAPHRIRSQVEDLLARNAEIGGADRLVFLDLADGRPWEYRYAGGAKRPWVAGGTLVYRRRAWLKQPFADTSSGEDTRFVWAHGRERIAVHPRPDFYVATIHAGNTCPRTRHGSAWRPWSGDLAGLMGTALDDYLGRPAPAATPVPAPTATVRTATPGRRCRVSVGVHANLDGERLAATCAAVLATTGDDAELLVLADGADASLEAVISGLPRFRRAGFAERRGAPACFNRLAAEAQGEVVVFMESGAVPGPGWLEALLAGLADDPRNGLAGPSTNRSWNMQQVFAQASRANVAATAAAARQRFGSAVRTTEPLYCLADFCYAVRRDVVDAIGAADEAYGEGPCWEMDYNVRAARAGWRPVWVPGSYVFRLPVGAERERRERALFDASRRRYQDKFCARHLNGTATDYKTHCRGEACANFAPRGQVALTIPLVAAASLPVTAAVASAAAPPRPLVSCIMPTRNRRPFIALTLQCFAAQDYAARELIIIDDGEDPIEDLVRDHPQVRYQRLNGRHSIGAKRNLACRAAQGAVFVHWDDDDWYGPHRIAAQVEPILAGRGQITGLDARWILTLDRREFWTPSAALHRRMFVGDIHGGTLAYARGVWEAGSRFPDVSLAEDAHFLRQAQQRGARLTPVANDELFVYMRHSDNAWQFEAGRFIDRQGWRRADPPGGFAPTLIERYAAAMRDSHA